MITTSNNREKTSIISISQEANEALIEYMKKEGFDPFKDYFFCKVKSGGCSGLSYDYGFKKENEIQEDEEVYKCNDINVLTNSESKLYLAGSILNYDPFNGGFFFKNPNASRTCGCGGSFS